jgi:hypothetical protein
MLLDVPYDQLSPATPPWNQKCSTHTTVRAGQCTMASW